MSDSQKPARQCQAESELRREFEEKTAQVGVIGLGYVGLPLSLLFARHGFSTTGFDIDSSKIARLRRGDSYIGHIPSSAISAELDRKYFSATDDFGALAQMDAIIICVPTPLDEHREPDLSYVRNTAGAHLRPGQLVVLESNPGTTEEVVQPILEKSGLRCPVAEYSPVGTSGVDGAQPRPPESPCPDFLRVFPKDGRVAQRRGASHPYP